VRARMTRRFFWVIREHVGLPATKYGCASRIGACSVHTTAKCAPCSVPVGSVKAADKIVTIEGFGEFVASVQKAGPRSTCRSALLPVRPDHGGGGALEEIRGRRQGHRRAMTICRCGTYQRIAKRSTSQPVVRPPGSKSSEGAMRK